MVGLLAITFHELGHALYLKLNKIEYDKGLDDVGFYFRLPNITKKQLIECALFGIILGLLPIFALIYFFSPYGFVTLLFYLAGCKNDIILVIKGGKK